MKRIGIFLVLLWLALPAWADDISGTINTYVKGSGNVAKGATSIYYTGLFRGAGTSISPGDQLLIIQSQGADINSSNTDQYGDGVGTGATMTTTPTSLHGTDGYAGGLISQTAGTFEYATVASVSGTRVTLTSGLEHAYSYSGADNWQIIVVPDYGSAGATLIGNITGVPWDGDTGGVIAFNATGGVIDFSTYNVNAAGIGFRGGVELYPNSTTDNIADVVAVTSYMGGKGEGIAGTPRYVYDGSIEINEGSSTLPGGDFGRGAPGNAGGGAGPHNSGGGGGSNAGAGGTGAQGWVVGTAVHFAGYGGQSIFAGANMGGGGGSGEANDGGPTYGGVGGGVILIRADSASGTGTLDVSGSPGTDATEPTNVAGDGAGGGGAGGTVFAYFSSPTTLTGLDIDASGGRGGNASPEHGGGGGGGAGLVVVNATVGTVNISGGVKGANQGVDGVPSQPGGDGIADTGIGAFARLNTDYGDAPDTYGTISGAGGAYHYFADYDFNGVLGTSEQLRLGANLDGEGSGNPSTAADSDDSTGLDDEDGVSGLSSIDMGQSSYTISASSITVTNTLATSATLHAWIDFDQNGTFDNDEYTSISIASGLTEQNPSSNLVWSAMPGITSVAPGSTTYLRLRLTTDSSIDATKATGAANNGEVEDHTLTVTDSNPEPVSITRSNPVSSLTNADQLEFTVTFSENVQSVDTGDFSVSGAGSSGATVSAVSGSGSSYTVTVDVANTDGAVNLAIAATTGIQDLTGNNLSTVTPTGTVESYTLDNTAPVISLLGDALVEVMLGGSYSDQGATAYDDVDGVLTSSIVTSGSVNTSVLGSYAITYNVTDTAGNAATPVTRTVNVTDQTPPVITLTGASSVDAPLDGSYTELGATATDNVDGDLTGSIVTSGSVNTSVLGSYTITYNVTDAAGNAATPVTRTVNVTDQTPPVITLTGASSVDVPLDDSYTELGATATDNVDGDLTGSIVISGAVDTSVPGSYTISYNVTDAAGNAATQVTRTVNVTDQTPPVITLTGASSVDAPLDGSYTELGATATDDVDGDLTGSIVTSGSVNTSVLGSYTITYNVTDAAGNAATPVTRTVNVTDQTPPVITLTGNSTVTVAQGGSYTELGATATDNVDGDISSSIVTSGSVNTSVLGSYAITYDVTDAAGNAATQVTRTVNVTTDTTPPVITLLGIASVDVPLGSPYSDAGATASDDIDGDITGDIVTVNPVNTSLIGSYTVTYDVTDAAGNAATQVTRTVNITFDTGSDEDGDGIPNGDEGSGDNDGDGVLDFQDLDSDNDGIPDSIEGNVDSDSDGVADYLDLDSDNDGIFDLAESGAEYATLDTLNDGTIDVTNTVGSNGLADAVETSADSGTLNYNGGSPLDSDADGVEDYVDLDSDNDTLADVIEAGGVDPDGDGIVGTDAPNVDANGVATSGAALPPVDTDEDGVNDQIDLDSDNDGIMDVVESGGDDPDGDGQIGTAPAQVDSNGLSVDGSRPELDTDGDGVPNQKDLDSDNDGIPDVTEGGGDDPDFDGIAGSGVPAVNALGVGIILNPDDIDGDNLLDPYDPDSDGDGIFDLVEGGGPDTDNDGMVDGFDDPNGDGFDDGITSSPLPLPDTDGDGIPDYKDNGDTDNDGIPDSQDVDDDNDGIPDALEGDGSIDTDGDGVPDSRDLDSDNDGLYDLYEVGIPTPALMDLDNDGRIDSTHSIGANGFADNLETTVDSGTINYNGGSLQDTDGDSVKDFRDLDSDNDSIPDVIEAGGDDGDGDGILGNGTPSVNTNGIATGSGQGPRDTDADGTPDQQDRDSDDDGEPDLQEAGGPDSDDNGEVDSFDDSNGDGFDDTIATAPRALPDTDGDGIPDYRDAVDVPVVPTAPDATKKVGAGLDGVGAFNFWILALLTVLAGLRQIRGVAVAALSVAMLLLMQGEAVAQQTDEPEIEAQAEVVSEVEAEPQQEDQQHFYIGAGIGTSTLQPETTGSGYSLDEDTDSGTRLYIGMDLTSSWSFELSVSDLGAATFKPTGTMEYKSTALNALYYLYNESENDHIGMGLYLKAGLAKLDVTSDIPFELGNSSQFSLGGGLEYAWENGFAVRADVESFDADAKLFTLGLLYRFGKSEPAPEPKDSDGDGVFDDKDQCPQTPAGSAVDAVGCELDTDGDGVVDSKDQCPQTPEGLTVDAVGCEIDSDGDGVVDSKDQCLETPAGAEVDHQGCSVDSDNDGVDDIQDQCPSTPANVKVDENGCSLDSDGDGVLNILDQCPDTIKGADVNAVGCAIFETRIEGVKFKLASAELTGSSKLILDNAASEIVKFPSVIVEVQAHTDSQGTLENNQNLSDRRALSVVNYLVTRGVPREALVAKGYGETRPAVSNSTPEGRAQNRRVELRVISAAE